jgi:hypothetical protein
VDYLGGYKAMYFTNPASATSIVYLFHIIYTCIPSDKALEIGIEGFAGES